jgi:hypothetical protein
MRFLFAILLAVIAVSSYAEWMPPLAPNAAEILREAQTDIKTKKYADSLAKHVWFYQHTLKFSPELHAVQLASALSSWRQLGKVYKPALIKLKFIRDTAEIGVKENVNEYEMFQGFVAINRELKEEKKTKDLFLWIDANNPELAHQVYPLVQRPLVVAKEYKVCGRYIEAESNYQRLVENYHRDLALSKDPKFGKEMQKFGEKSFSNGVTTLIALLVVNGRPAEAEKIAAAAPVEWNNPSFQKDIKKALKGKVPKPWIK